MLVRGFVHTIKDGLPVANGTEVRIYSHDTNSLLATTTTLSGEYEHNFQGNPGPYKVEVTHAGETHISSSKVVGMSGPTNIGGIPLLFRLWHDGYIPDLLDELEVTSTGVGMQVQVGGGAAICRGVLYDQSSTLPLNIDAADGQQRIDVVALQVVPAGADDDKEGRALLVVKKGTPAGTPVPPSLTQTSSLWEMALAHVTVDIGASSIAGNKVADVRPQSNVKIGDGYITTAMIGDGQVTTPKILDGAVTTTKLDTMAVTTAKIASEAVTTAKIENGAVTSAKLGAKAVTAYSLGDNAVLTHHIQNGAVTPVKLSQAYALSSHTHSWGQVTGKPSTFAPSSHSHSWGEITSKPSTFTPSSHTHSGADITAGSINEDRLAQAVRNKLNNSYTPSVGVDRNTNKRHYGSSSVIQTRNVTLSAGTYAWFSIGTARVTGETSSSQVAGWLQLRRGSTEQNAEPFYTTADPYGISVQVTAGGTFTLSASSTQTFDIRWARDSGTATFNTTQLMTWIQRVS